MNVRDQPEQRRSGDDDGRNSNGRAILVVTPETPKPRIRFDQWLLDLDAFLEGRSRIEGALTWLKHAQPPEVPEPRSIVGVVSAAGVCQRV